ncbi:uncharacterized protein LOC128554676 [Mercenaria mercenaria]|uniref:uncharacterized protein LOC128554676 n=1 Tax=Mercenaria mercenaria TaxID=6596 RepID=UPI00234F47D1|nr:uncharacterized protein LOC128554676 [Mercenaria mercenaria]
MRKASPTCTFVFFVGCLINQDLVVGEDLSDYLWEQTKVERQDALDSVFVQEIKNVSLDPVQFGAYLVQDAIYLYSAKRSMDIAASRTNDVTLKTFLQEYAIKRYTSLYTNALKDWHIDDPSAISLGNGCENYVNHLLAVAETMDPIYLVVANIPCERLWPWIGEQVGVGSEDFGIYNKWVNENWDPKIDVHLEFEQVMNDAHAEGKIDKDKALKVYKESMKGEVEFFNSVLAPAVQLQGARDEL